MGTGVVFEVRDRAAAAVAVRRARRLLLVRVVVVFGLFIVGQRFLADHSDSSSWAGFALLAATLAFLLRFLSAVDELLAAWSFNRAGVTSWGRTVIEGVAPAFVVAGFIFVGAVVVWACTTSFSHGWLSITIVTAVLVIIGIGLRPWLRLRLGALVALEDPRVTEAMRLAWAGSRNAGAPPRLLLVQHAPEPHVMMLAPFGWRQDFVVEMTQADAQLPDAELWALLTQLCAQAEIGRLSLVGWLLRTAFVASLTIGFAVAPALSVDGSRANLSAVVWTYLVAGLLMVMSSGGFAHVRQRVTRGADQMTLQRTGDPVGFARAIRTISQHEGSLIGPSPAGAAGTAAQDRVRMADKWADAHGIRAPRDAGLGPVPEWGSRPRDWGPAPALPASWKSVVRPHRTRGSASVRWAVAFAAPPVLALFVGVVFASLRVPPVTAADQGALLMADDSRSSESGWPIEDDGDAVTEISDGRYWVYRSSALGIRRHPADLVPAPSEVLVTGVGTLPLDTADDTASLGVYCQRGAEATDDLIAFVFLADAQGGWQTYTTVDGVTELVASGSTRAADPIEVTMSCVASAPDEVSLVLFAGGEQVGHVSVSADVPLDGWEIGLADFDVAAAPYVAAYDYFEARDPAG